MSWNSVIGQNRAKKLLMTTLESHRLAHAYLFSGPQGVGKDAAAIELAKVVNCEKGGIEACGQCKSCSKMNRLQHPNVNLVFSLPVGKGEKYGDSPLARLSDDEITVIQQQIELKANNPYHSINIPKANGIKINSIRDIRKESVLTAFGFGKKVFIIMDAENLSDESSNALLKTLEEPHDDTLLILTTSQPEVLLPTIISRCQHIRFDPLTFEEIKHGLQERQNLDGRNADLIAGLAKGSFKRAMELTDTTVKERQNDAVNFLRMALYKTRQNISEEIDRIVSDYQKTEVEEFLLLMQVWLQNAMNLSEGHPVAVEAEDRESLQKFVQHHPHLRYDQLLACTNNAISLLHKNVYIPLILINLAVELKNIILPQSQSQNAMSFT